MPRAETLATFIRIVPKKLVRSRAAARRQAWAMAASFHHVFHHVLSDALSSPVGMDKVQHLWNLIGQLASNPLVENAGLQAHYVERCRRMQSEVELPRRIFGPGEMCSYCGSLWSKIDHRVRLAPGKTPGKSVRRMMKGDKKLSRVKETLAKKAAKNFGNKAVIRCSFCSKSTEISLAKPARLKAKGDSIEDEPPVGKKRKKRTKDKTAGLIITPKSQTPICRKPRDFEKKAKAKVTNLNKLGAMISKNPLTPSKKSSLHDFITELGN